MHTPEDVQVKFKIDTGLYNIMPYIDIRYQYKEF